MKEEEQNVIHKASFEEAIAATKFGKFNILFIFTIIPSAMTFVMNTSIMSYIIPVAHCDLNLSLQEKGLLNASYSIGSIISAYIWGVLGDVYGRRNILLYTYGMDFLVNFVSAFLPSFWFLFFLKLLSGFLSCGPFSLLMIYAAELHSVKYRSKIVFVVGLSMTFTLFAMPLLVGFVMPLPDLSLNQFVLHSWQLYILILTIPTLLATSLYILLPESPKFLMTIGEIDKALQIFRKIYRINTGNSEDTYKFNDLVDESYEGTTTCKNNQKSSILQIINKGILKLKPVWQPPYLSKLILIFLANFLVLMSSNSLRFWFPQLLTSIDEFNQLNGIDESNFCIIINNSFHNLTMKHDNATECIIVPPKKIVYLGLIISGASCFIASIFILIIINRCRKNWLLITLLTIGGCLLFGNNWSTNVILTLAILLTIIVLTIQSSVILMSLNVDLFPTNVRATASCITIMAGQLGSVVGNLIFPFLLSLGCVAPFAFLNGTILFSAVLCFFIPKSNEQDF